LIGRWRETVIRPTEEILAERKFHERAAGCPTGLTGSVVHAPLLLSKKPDRGHLTPAFFGLSTDKSGQLRAEILTRVYIIEWSAVMHRLFGE
jgi:hypothetical protein